MRPSDSERIGRAEIREAGGDRTGGEQTNAASIHLPAPSVWPVTVAAALTLLMFGFITHPGFIAVGILIMILGLARWIGELLRG